ncbi:MAG: hypothetical protein ISS82_02190 [Nanoarchaeota archaeon]|nr:hypothetical protein [Nanoarchaeota archaeon]
MKKEVFEKIKNESMYLSMIFIIFLILFKIIFFKENLMVIFKTVISIFWLFIIPGYFILFYWDEKLGFTERLIIGIALSAAVIGILSYYLGIIGLNIKYHTIILPLILILIGIFINFKRIR